MNNAKHIIDTLKKELADVKIEAGFENIGRVIEIKDGIARVSGLSQCFYNELLEFQGGVLGMALNLEEDSVGVIVLGDYSHIKEGDTVKTTGNIASVPVSDDLLGRVINPLGEPQDGRENIHATKRYPIEKIAAGVIERKAVSVPIETGIRAIDALIPIGRGQRELIIGDRQTGKTAIAVDTIINQKGKNVICIYVAIGQKESKTAKIVAEFKKAGAMAHTIVVNASAGMPASLQYIAPFSASAIAEYFMDQGKDVLVVYDDLSKHAWSYREISLLLRRPPGREAYPGDVFYLHSRLLERSARRDEKYGGGSITALPIIETQQGDVSAYIPTNVISITDGQIYLDTDLFYAGTRPALNIGLSVSRVGSSAQTKSMKQFAGKLRLDLAQFRELAAFAQFEGDLDEGTKNQIARGRRLIELLKQPQYAPQTLGRQVLGIFAVTQGMADDIDPKNIASFDENLFRYVQDQGKEIIEEIEKGEKLDDKTQEKLKEMIVKFKEMS
ncbi:MAG: F0F1 ATP synthase subunit alpha [Candidatus Paceibacterota bacterium]|jgi:F-type H+-transporting ATPase subunit alpha|nr:F0F1 ATP synthase subunit alpha [Candidatus Paceibacterota bacterium]